ncbi:MAG: hypothetical protein QOH86_1600, partial [Sphingomonadales bacterium]|nr:hypothetical protein [Sphingomonadales bacterium]
LTGGVLFPTEDRRWLVTLMGFAGHYPPTGEADFEDFARELRTPLIYEAIRRAEPLGPIFGTRALQNRRRRFERWRHPVSGLVVIGDAVASMNPIYGQGMSLAAAAAALLGQCARELDPCDADFAGVFLKRQAALLAVPWRMSTASDFAYPGTTGAQPPFSSLRNLYLNMLIEAAWHDPALHRRLVRVIHLLDDPRRLFSPAIAAQAAAAALTRRGRGPAYLEGGAVLPPITASAAR